jgi:hypothetical protein
MSTQTYLAAPVPKVQVSTRIACAFVGVLVLLCAAPTLATGWYPAARLHFSAPARDPQEIVAVLAQVLEARHFQLDGQVAVAPNGHFRAIYRAPSGEQVWISGDSLSCVLVSIYAGRPDDVVPDFERGREFRAAFVEHLRAVFGERVTLYKPGEFGQLCVQAL